MYTATHRWRLLHPVDDDISDALAHATLLVAHDDRLGSAKHTVAQRAELDLQTNRCKFGVLHSADEGRQSVERARNVDDPQVLCEVMHVLRQNLQDGKLTS